jgi:hypothetical protein
MRLVDEMGADLDGLSQLRAFDRLGTQGGRRIGRHHRDFRNELPARENSLLGK